MGIEKVKGAEVIDSLSITTLMKIVPEEQWLLVPSIKYMLYKEQTGQLSLSDARLLKSATDKSETALEGGGATEEKDKGNKGKKQSIDPEKDEAAVPPEGKAAKGRRGSDNKETGDKKKKRPSKDYATDAAAADAKTKPEERINPPSSDIDVDVIPSFHISEAIGQRKSMQSKPINFYYSRIYALFSNFTHLDLVLQVPDPKQKRRRSSHLPHTRQSLTFTTWENASLL